MTFAFVPSRLSSRWKMAAGVVVIEERPARAAVYEPLLRGAVALEWETVAARLVRGGGEGVLGVVWRGQKVSESNVLRGVPPRVSQIPVEPHLALYYGGLHDGVVDTRAGGLYVFVEWDIFGVHICVVSVEDSNTRLRSQSFEASLRTQDLVRTVAQEVILPAVAVAGADAVWADLGETERQRLFRTASELLRRCWFGERESFSCALVPVAHSPVLRRGSNFRVNREVILAQCRLSLAAVLEMIHATIEEGLGNGDTLARVVISGEIARWQELQGVVTKAWGSAVVVPPQPECFAARGAAIAAAHEARVLQSRRLLARGKTEGGSSATF